MYARMCVALCIYLYRQNALWGKTPMGETPSPGENSCAHITIKNIYARKLGWAKLLRSGVRRDKKRLGENSIKRVYKNSGAKIKSLF